MQGTRAKKADRAWNRTRMGKKKKKRMKIIRRVVLCALAASALALAIRIVPDFMSYQKSANEILMNMDENTFRRAGNTKIYDGAGDLIGEIGNEKYEYVSYSDVSPYITSGYIAREDKRFLEHGGIDIIAIGRAALANFTNGGEIKEGGSTITQQVVKNTLLTSDRTYERKILEMLLAMRLERQYTKDQIMEFYVNSCYYGNSCYGIEGASEYYFGCTARELTLSEAAMLVATSNSPSAVNPETDYDSCIEKRDSVLENMLDEGMITDAEYENAKLDRPEVVMYSDAAPNDSYMITYAIHCAALELMKRDGFEFRYVIDDGDEYAEYRTRYNTAYDAAVSDIRSGGYSIYTSFDTRVEAALQESVDSGLSDFTETQEDGRYEMQGAAVCIDNTTGLVVAVVGGRGTEDSYNRAYRATRQPGSAIKPLLDYAPAIDTGTVTPLTVYNDAPYDDNGYMPENAGGAYYGDVTVREALARSLNTVALQIYINTGRKSAMQYLDALCFTSIDFADTSQDAVSIGGFTNGVTVSDMAKGYAAIEMDGVYTDATCIVAVETESGEVLYDVTEDAEHVKVYGSDTAFIMRDMMTGTVNASYGTAHRAENSSQVYAGKTGTTNGSKDGWFCGFSAYYTTAVWVGCDTPQEVSGLSGSTWPLTIWSDFMDTIHDGLEKKEFDIPDSVYLINSDGDKKAVTYTDNVWESRPSGWDYTSDRLIDLAREADEERLADLAYASALDAVEELEEWQIESAEDAVSLEERYNAVLELCYLVSDDTLRSQLLERAAYKYNLLSGDVAAAWADAEEVVKKAEQSKRDAENEAAALESLYAAQRSSDDMADEVRAAWVSVVEGYITAINSAVYYTDDTKEMIERALSALEHCAAYPEYTSLARRLDQARETAEALPDMPDGAMPDEEDT